jgi:hypothetical protein
MATIDDIRVLVIPRIKDTDGKLSIAPDDTCDLDRAIQSARSEYDASFPREAVVEIPGNGGFDYAIALLVGYVDGFSDITQIRYPVAMADPSPPLLDDQDWVIVRLPTGLVLRFLGGLRPGAAEKIHIYFTTPHEVDTDACTVPAAHFDALADLAAAAACLMLSGLYEQTSDGTYKADAVDRPSRASTYRSLAKEYRTQYRAKLGLDNTTVKPGFAVADINPPSSAPQVGGLLFHERR